MTRLWHIPCCGGGPGHTGAVRQRGEFDSEDVCWEDVATVQ